MPGTGTEERTRRNSDRPVAASRGLLDLAAELVNGGVDQVGAGDGGRAVVRVVQVAAEMPVALEDRAVLRLPPALTPVLAASGVQGSPSREASRSNDSSAIDRRISESTRMAGDRSSPASKSSRGPRADVPIVDLDVHAHRHAPAEIMSRQGRRIAVTDLAGFEFSGVRLEPRHSAALADRVAERFGEVEPGGEGTDRPSEVAPIVPRIADRPPAVRVADPLTSDTVWPTPVIRP